MFLPPPPAMCDHCCHSGARKRQRAWVGRGSRHCEREDVSAVATAPQVRHPKKRASAEGQIAVHVTTVGKAREIVEVLVVRTIHIHAEDVTIAVCATLRRRAVKCCSTKRQAALWKQSA